MLQAILNIFLSTNTTKFCPIQLLLMEIGSTMVEIQKSLTTYEYGSSKVQKLQEFERCISMVVCIHHSSPKNVF